MARVGLDATACTLTTDPPTRRRTSTAHSGRRRRVAGLIARADPDQISRISVENPAIRAVLIKSARAL
nr:hypothetical protein [Streptomyces sp. 846.5]